MGDYAASVRVNTKIDTSDMKKLENSFAKVAERAAIAKDKVDALDRAGTSHNADTYKAAVSELEKWNKELDKLGSRKKNTSLQFPKTEGDFSSLSDQVEDYETRLKELRNQGFGAGDEIYDGLYLAWRNVVDVEKEYLENLNKQTDKGIAEEAERLAKAKEKEAEQQRKIEEMAERNLQKENARLEKEAQIQSKIQEQEAEQQRLNDIRQEAVVSDERLVSLLQEQETLQARLNDLKKAGVTAGYAEHDAVTGRLQEISSEIDLHMGKSKSKLISIANVAKKAFSSVSSVIKKGLSGVTGLFHKIGQLASKVFGRMHKDTGKQNSLLGMLKSRLGGIALSLLVFNWISKGFRAMIAGMKEGLQNLAQYSKDYNVVMSDMVSALATLKNAFATAFSPIATIVIPYITQLINYLTAAVNKVAQFVSALTGKTTWTKAKKQTIDYAQSLNKVSKSAKEAYRSLASFDELNVLNKNDTSESDAGIIDPSSMFEELPIDSKIKDFADKIKDILRGDDWSEIGRMIAAKLNEAMRKIPWDKIQSETRRIASGIATLLNGFIYELDWSLLGYTLAQGLNTALIFLNTFAEKFDWKALGKSLSEGLNALVAYFDWKLLGEAIKNWWNGIVDFLYEFIVDTDWKKLGESIGEAFNTALNGIDWMHTAEMLGEGINSIFEFLLGLGEEIQWGQIGFEIANFLNEGFNAIDSELAGESVRTWIDGIFQAALVALKGTDWGQVGSDLAVFLNESILYADWKQIGATLSELAEGFLDFLLEAVETLDWEQVGRDIIDFLMNIDWEALSVKLLLVIVQTILGLREGIEAAFLELASYLPDGFFKGLIEGFVGLDKWVDEHIFKPFIKEIKNLFGIHSPSTVMAEIGKFLISGLIKGIGDKTSDLKESLTNIYNTVKGVLDKLKSFINDMVSSMKEKISTITSGVSSAWKSVTSGTSKIFGKSVDSTSYAYEIPALATGGITTGTTIAKIGEAGREAVLPLENNTGWMDVLADKINGGGEFKFIAELDGDIIFQKTVDKNQVFKKRNGGRSAYA